MKRNINSFCSITCHDLSYIVEVILFRATLTTENSAEITDHPSICKRRVHFIPLLLYKFLTATEQNQMSSIKYEATVVTGF